MTKQQMVIFYEFCYFKECYFFVQFQVEVFHVYLDQHLTMTILNLWPVIQFFCHAYLQIARMCLAALLKSQVHVHLELLAIEFEVTREYKLAPSTA